MTSHLPGGSLILLGKHGLGPVLRSLIFLMEQMGSRDFAASNTGRRDIG